MTDPTGHKIDLFGIPIIESDTLNPGELRLVYLPQIDEEKRRQIIQAWEEAYRGVGQGQAIFPGIPSGEG